MFHIPRPKGNERLWPLMTAITLRTVIILKIIHKLNASPWRPSWPTHSGSDWIERLIHFWNSLPGVPGEWWNIFWPADRSHWPPIPFDLTPLNPGVKFSTFIRRLDSRQLRHHVLWQAVSQCLVASSLSSWLECNLKWNVQVWQLCTPIWSQNWVRSHLLDQLWRYFAHER